MDENADVVATHADKESLPVTQTLMHRLAELRDASGSVSGGDAVPPIVDAIAALERVIVAVGAHTSGDQVLAGSDGTHHVFSL